MVFSLCAIVSTVQSSNWVLIVIWIRSSVSRSIAAVASSRIKTLVLRSSALARQTSCLWPTLQAETRLSQRPCCPAAPTVHNHLSSMDAVTQPKKKKKVFRKQDVSPRAKECSLQHCSITQHLRAFTFCLDRATKHPLSATMSKTREANNDSASARVLGGTHSCNSTEHTQTSKNKVKRFWGWTSFLPANIRSGWPTLPQALPLGVCGTGWTSIRQSSAHTVVSEANRAYQSMTLCHLVRVFLHGSS